MKHKEESFLTRVRRSLPGLSPAEKRLGDFLCDFPGEVASYLVHRVVGGRMAA